MTLLIALVVGCAIGAAVGFWLLKNIEYLIFTVLAGIVGAILGLAFYSQLGTETTDSLITLTGILSYAVGALIAVMTFVGLNKIMPKRTASQTNVQEPDTKIEDE